SGCCAVARTLVSGRSGGRTAPPRSDRIDQWQQFLSKRCERVFDAQRVTVVSSPAHDFRGLQLAQLEGQYSVRYRWIVTSQLAETFCAVLQIVEQQGRPTAAQDAHGVFDWAM